MILPKNETMIRNTESKQRYRRYAMILLVVCAGISFSFLSFSIVRRLETQRLQTELQLHTQTHVNAIKKDIGSNLNALRFLSSFFKSSEAVYRDEFRTFTKDILQHTPGVQAIEWIPRVLLAQREKYERDARLDGFQNFQITERGEQGEMIRAGERDEYFPVCFVEPYRGNEIALGYNLASNPSRMAALEKSRDTGQMTATARITLVQETGKEYGFLVFLPVYRKKALTDTIESRRKNLTGFVLGVYRVGTFVKNAFKYPGGLTIHIYDKSSPPGESLLYPFSRQTRRNANLMEPENKFRFSSSLNVADRQWELVCEFSPDFLAYSPMMTSWAVLVGSLLLTCLFAVYLVNNIKRTIQIENLANRLSSEAAERKKVDEAFQRSEKNYRLLFEGSTNGIMAFDIETKRFVYANPAASRMFGYPEIELEQMSIADFHPKDSLIQVMSEFESQVRGEKTTSSGLPCLRKDGTIFYADITGSNTIIDEKKCSVGFITDVTERKHWELSLRRNEAQLANACEMGHLGPWEYDIEKDLFTLTDSFYAIFGTTAEEVGGYTMSSSDCAKRFVHPEDVSLVGLETMKAVETDDPKFIRQFEHRFLDAEGEIGYISVRFFNIKDTNGQTIKTYGVNQDITERLRREKALKESEKTYRELFENSTDFVYTADMKGTFTDANRAAEDLTGYTKDEIIGMNYMDYTPENTHEGIFEAFSMVLNEAKPLKDFPLEVIIKDGTKRYFETCVSPLRKGEEVIGFQGSSRDVTKRKRTEDALYREKERFKFLVEGSPLGVALINKEELYKYINPKFTEIFGYTLEDIPTRQQWFIKAYPDEKDRKRVIFTLKDDQKKYGIGEVRPRSFEVTCKDGSRKIIRLRLVTMETGDQLLIYEDITETQRLEEQLRQTQKMEAIGTLAGGIAHDFNNILASLIGYTELAIDYVDDKKELLEDLQEVRKAGNRAKDLVSQILAFSRQSEKELKPIKAEPIVKEALKLLRSSLPTTIEIRDNILSDALVMADPTQIHQVMMNLCTNASHAMQEKGGILEVALTDVYLDSSFTSRYPDIKTGNFLKLTVRDTGHGIAPDILDQIFNPFFTTKEKGEGTGLGLSVVHGIIKSAGGTITVYSEPEEGSEFNLYLPIIEREVKEEQGFEIPLSTGSERILFVDDEQPIREMSKKLLESLGYRVEVRSNGIEALEFFKVNPESFDLIITDMTMPNMTGAQLAEQLMSVRSDIPIILCTGFSTMIDEKKSNAMGIRAFVLKPIIKSDIAKIIRMVLDDARGSQG